MHRFIALASALAVCFFSSGTQAQQLTMPVHDLLANEFDQTKLDGKWMVTSVEEDSESVGGRCEYTIGDFILLSADANVGLYRIGCRGFQRRRAVGATYMKKIDEQFYPKQIDIVVDLDNVGVQYYDDAMPQEEQLQNCPMRTRDCIYRLSRNDAGDDELRWCFAKYGNDRPDDFVVCPKSGRTLVTLKRCKIVPGNPWANLILSNVSSLPCD